MPWSAGTFSLNQDFPADALAGDPDNIITAAKVDNELQNIKAGLEQCMTTDGQTTVTANIPMAGFVFTGLGQGAAKTSSANLEQITNHITNYAAFGGTATAWTATLGYLSTTIPTGALVRGTVPADTTGATTIAVNGGSALSVVNFDGSAIGAGDFLSGDYIVLRRTATGFAIIPPQRNHTTGLPVYALTSISGADTITAASTYGSLKQLYTGMLVTLTAASNNTGAATLNIDSLGATAVEDVGSNALGADELVAGATYLLYYDGTVFRVLNSLGAATGVPLLAANNLSDLASAATARTNLGVDAAGTDNSTDVTLAGSLDYLTLSGQEITRGAIDLTTDVTGALPVANGGTASTTASGARTALGVAIGSDVQAYDADTLKADTADRLTANLGFTPDSDSSSGGSITWNFGVPILKTTLTENITSITLSGATDGDKLEIWLTQDSTARTVSGWPAAVKWSGGGTAPTISTTSGAVDIVTLRYDGTNYHASIVQDHQ